MDPNGGGIRVAPMENMNSIEHGHIVTTVSRRVARHVFRRNINSGCGIGV